MTIDKIDFPQTSGADFQLYCSNTGLRYDIDEEMLIGRELDCSIRLAAPQIRRYHAKISKSEDGLFLEDLNANNNTCLNGSRIGDGAWVTLGDEISFDGINFVIQTIEQSEDPLNNSSFSSSLNLQDNKKKPDNAPFSSQDVLEATRALEQRAKARLEFFKSSPNAAEPPNWESYISNQSLLETSSGQQANEPKPNQDDDINRKVSQTDSSNFSTNSANHRQNVMDSDVYAQIAHADILSEDAQNEDNYDLGRAANDSSSKNETQTEKLPYQPLTYTPEQPVIKQDPSGPRLIVQNNQQEKEWHSLQASDTKSTWTIGRFEGADIRVNEAAIDRIHAHIESQNEHYKIRTTRTTNGMLINGHLKGEAILKHGDIIKFGHVSFQYLDGSNAITSTIKDLRRGKAGVGWAIALVTIATAVAVTLLNSQ